LQVQSLSGAPKFKDDTMIVTYLPWLMSAMTIWMTLLAGNNHPRAWAVGLINQVFWVTWIIASETWGLIPMSIELGIVYARNHFKWNPK
jgi:hypothetical protein